MKKTNKTALVLLLASLILSASCGNTDSGKPSGTESNDGGTTVTEEETTEELSPNLEAVDCGGEAFRILTRTTDLYCRQTDDITAEEINGNVLNDKIYERNQKIQDKYNTVFEIISYNDVSPKVKTSVTSGDDSYDIVLDGISNTVVYSANGYLYELSTFPNLDITAPWWNKKIMSDMSIFDKYYVGINDMTIQAYYSAGIVYFNKNMAQEYDIEDPYELVRSGKWTFDKLCELCRNVSKDLDGDGQLTEKDQYGITYNNFAWQILYYGINEPFIKKDNDGELYFDSKNEKIINYLQKMFPAAQDDTVTLYSEKYSKLGGNYRIDVCTSAFNEGRAMFWLEAMYGVPQLRDMGNDFGILPTPKYDEKQESYTSFIHTLHGSSMSIPVTVPENRLDVVGRIVEDMAYESSKLVKPAFIETTIKGKYARDTESADMIDIVMNGISTDYTLLLNTYGLSIDGDMRKFMDKGSTEVTSLFAEKADKWTSILEKYCDNFRD